MKCWNRWDKPIRIVPDSEVAGKIAEMLKGKNVVMPENVVTPNIRAELEKAGGAVEGSDRLDQSDLSDSQK